MDPSYLKDLLWRGREVEFDYGANRYTIKLVDYRSSTEYAFGRKVVCGVVGDALVEDDGVLLGHEECDLWFVAEHIIRHFIAFFGQDIGWVADDDVPLAPIVLGHQGIVYLEGDRCLEGGGIVAGDVEGCE